MKKYTTQDFVRTGNETLLGKYYAGYKTLEIQHRESGAKVNILVDADGDPVESANKITDRIRSAFSIDGRESKVIPLMIDDYRFLVLKFPDI